jgi:hypothetical protein
MSKQTASWHVKSSADRQSLEGSTVAALASFMKIVLNSRVVPEELRKVVEGVVKRFTFSPQRFQWMATPSDDVVLSSPPVIVEFPLNLGDDEGRLLREGIEEEIQNAIERLLPFTEPFSVEARQ